MKTLIAILILLSFLQTSIIPVNLVLIILVLRAYIRVDKSNLMLAFFFGLLVALLSHTNLGLTALIYLILVNITHLLSKSPLSKNIFSVAPIILVSSVILELFSSVSVNQTPIFWPKTLIDGVLSLPLYLGLKIWEERFVVRTNIKLKMR